MSTHPDAKMHEANMRLLITTQGWGPVVDHIIELRTRMLAAEEKVDGLVNDATAARSQRDAAYAESDRQKVCADDFARFNRALRLLSRCPDGTALDTHVAELTRKAERADSPSAGCVVQPIAPAKPVVTTIRDLMEDKARLDWLDTLPKRRGWGVSINGYGFPHIVDCDYGRPIREAIDTTRKAVA